MDSRRGTRDADEEEEEHADQEEDAPMHRRSLSVALTEAVRDKDTWMATVQARAEELRAYQETRRSWRVYRLLCQFRFGYLSFLVLMVVLVFSFTLLMEMFFAIFLPSARTYTSIYFVRAVIMLVLFPVILCLLSYVFEETCRFFSDAVNKKDGGLPNFRLALAVVIHYIRHRREILAVSAHPNPALAASAAVAQSSHSSLFLSSKDDPYDDRDKEEEDAQGNARDEAEQERDPTAASTSILEPTPMLEDAPPVQTAAHRRWIKATNAVLATVLLRRTEMDGPPIDYSTFVLVDFICPVLFEVVDTIAFLITLFRTFSPYQSFLEYVRIGFWFTMAYVAIWIAVHFWSSRNPYMRLIVSNYRRRRRALQRDVHQMRRGKKAEYLWLLEVGFRFFYHLSVLINIVGWMPCCSARMQDADSASEDEDDGNVVVEMSAIDDPDALPSKSFSTRLHHIHSLRAKLRSCNPWFTLSYNLQGFILLLVCVAAALVSLESFLIGWPLLGIGMIMLSHVLQCRFPQIFGHTFKRFITWFVVLSLIFFSSTWLIGTFVTGGHFELGPPTDMTRMTTLAGVANVTGKGGVTIRHGESVEYPACSVDYDGLTVLDLALIADAAYGETPAEEESAIRNRFNGTALQGVEFEAFSNQSEHQAWMELYFRSINMTVIAVRGTASATDALEDLHFWFGITILQVVNTVVPFLNQLPQAFVVSLLSMRIFNPVMPNPVYLPLLKHVQAVKQRVGDNLVVTGHSLGGSMAAMVGAKTKARAISFSGPGLMYSRGRFDVQEDDIRDYVLTLKPKNDIVPQVDELGGMVQEIRCWESNPKGCHSTYTHICELQASCGDVRHRNWASNEECTEYRALMKP